MRCLLVNSVGPSNVDMYISTLHRDPSRSKSLLDSLIQNIVCNIATTQSIRDSGHISVLLTISLKPVIEFSEMERTLSACEPHTPEGRHHRLGSDIEDGVGSIAGSRTIADSGLLQNGIDTTSDSSHS